LLSACNLQMQVSVLQIQISHKLMVYFTETKI
jgi:hypothetical protein